jgi:beta-N-acetylhexosaminidase
MMTLGPLMVDVAGLSLTRAEVRILRDSRIGGVILFTRNYQDRTQVTALIEEIRAVRKPSLLVAVDQEGGRVQRFRNDFTTLPSARWLGHQYDLDESKGRHLTSLCGWLMAMELRAVGVDFSFAPVLDLDWGLSEIIGDRAFHRDPDVVATLAGAFAQGMRKAGMVAVVKHFPGHGAVVPDSHVELPVDHRSYEEIVDDMRPYERLIDNGVQGVMMAHVLYPTVDRRIASLSPYWLQSELRRRLNFGGVIFSDDLNMSAMEDVGDMAERTKVALDAGADMALICNNPDGVALTLDKLQYPANPPSQSRLVAMRPGRGRIETGDMRATEGWRTAVAAIRDAVERPVLELDG